jgi:hydrogenase nickel incorporation protein HypB
VCEHCGCGDKNHHSHDHSHDHGVETVRIEQDVLAHNRAHAEALKARLDAAGARLVNIIGGPGSGKTELLSRLIPLVRVAHPAAVIEGDLATDNDAERIRATGAPVYQIETGTACHLSVHDIEHAVAHLGVPENGVLFVENVGNLVCPALFELGESLRMVCLSVTEGEDKPEKYPVAFIGADCSVITKTDLLPYVDFDVERATTLIRQIHPDATVHLTSAKQGEGLSKLAAHIGSLWHR